MIAVFGGTFNPVHFGHLRTALEVKTALGDCLLKLVPCRLPVHREAPEVDASVRLEMLKLALQGQHELELDDRELTRERPSYMWDTLASLREEAGPGRPLALVIGLDSYLNFSSWYRWQDIFDLAHLIILQRPNYPCAPPEELQQAVRSRVISSVEILHSESHGYVFFHDVTQLDISSSAIREMILHGRSPRYLLPDAVLNFIEDRQLYRSASSAI